MPFMPGKSGNPNGRPKKELTLTHLLLEYGKIKEIPYKKTKISRLEALTHKMWELALSGDVGMIKYLTDRIDGSPRQTMDLQATIIDVTVEEE